ncbi:MAG TPA: type II CAAX endopeptidase family protein [Chitinophagaceae bacterium]|nr:type II CAAX endopeptidase family protein [Chitinophagaceae bacterium]
MPHIGNILTWQRVPARDIRFKRLEEETSFLLGYAIFYIFLGYGIGVLIQNYPQPLMGATQFNQDAWYSILFKIFFLLIVPSFIYFGWWKYKLRDLLLGIRPGFSTVVATIVMMLLGFFLNASHLSKISAHYHEHPDAFLRVFIGVMMPLFTAGIPEELFFRGYLQTRLEKKWNRLFAILLTSILFMAWHLPSRYLLSRGIEGQAGHFDQVLLQTGLPVFIISLIFGFHWSRYRNIVLLVLTHWAVDVLPSVSSFLKIPF